MECSKHINKISESGTNCEKKSIAFGVTSMVLGVIGFLTVFILIRVPSLAVKIIGSLWVLISIVMIFEILAIIIGVISIISKKQKSRFGIAGIIIAVCSILFVVWCYRWRYIRTVGTITNDPSAKTSSIDVDNSDFAITKYSCHDGADYTTYVLVIKNNSKETVDLSGEITAYDSTGKKVDAIDSFNSDSCYAAAPSKSGCLQFKYDAGDASSFKYSIWHDISTWSNTVPLLRFEESQNDNNVVVTYTNNSNKSASNIRASIIFFNGDTPVSCKKTNIPSADAEIKPDEHGSVELNYYQNLTIIKYFMKREGRDIFTLTNQQVSSFGNYFTR